MSRSLRAHLAVLASSTLLLGLGMAAPPRPAVAPVASVAAPDPWTATLAVAHHERTNADYWSSERTRRSVEERRRPVEVAVVADPRLADSAPLEPPSPEPPPAAPGALRQAEPPELPEPPAPVPPPPLPLVAAQAPEVRREPLTSLSRERTFTAASVGAPGPSVVDVELIACRWSPRSDTLTGTYTMTIEGGEGFTLIGGTVAETRGPGGPGRATAETAERLADPAEVIWSLRLGNGSSARDGLPLHVVEDVGLLAADGSELRVPAPQQIIPLADAGCTQDPPAQR